MNTAKIAEPISGNKLYQKRAKEALPLLIHQVKKIKRPITYEELAKKVGMPNARNLNYVLGSIGTTLVRLSKAWQKEIPPIQFLVVNKNTHVPGKGILGFLNKKERAAYKSGNEMDRETIVKKIHNKIFNFKQWQKVLSDLALTPSDNPATSELKPPSLGKLFSGKKTYFLMHLNYNDQKSRVPLWDYSVDRSVIGIDHREIKSDWKYVSPKQKESLRRNGWEHQLDLFCNVMKEKDVVFALAGQRQLLGIGIVDGNYNFENKKPVNKWDEIDWGYFRFSRPVRWIRTTPLNKPITVNFPGFNNTILEVGPNTKKWKLLTDLVEKLGFKNIEKESAKFKKQNDDDYEVNIEGGKRTRSRNETKLVNFVAKYFNHHNVKVEDIKSSFPIDLHVLKPRKAIFEAKIIKGNGVREVRSAIGQLFWYQYKYVNDKDAVMCVLLDKKPSSDLEKFIEKEVKIGIVWKSKNRVFGGPNTYRLLSRLGIIKSL